jgi:hypothetical protein
MAELVRRQSVSAYVGCHAFGLQESDDADLHRLPRLASDPDHCEPLPDVTVFRDTGRHFQTSACRTARPRNVWPRTPA